jgi:hypothetical protein
MEQQFSFVTKERAAEHAAREEWETKINAVQTISVPRLQGLMHGRLV